MPPRISDDKRAAILDDIKAGGNSCRGIARKHGVSDRVVRKIADENGITDAWSRAQTENATRARQADVRAQRTELKAVLLDDVRKLRERAWSPYTYYERGKEGPEKVTLDLPPLGEARNAYTAIGIALDKHIALERIDSDGGADRAKGMIGALAAGLRAAYDQLPTDDQS
jgi:transposase-like protein